MRSSTIRAAVEVCLVVAGLLSVFPAFAIRLDIAPAFTQKFLGDEFGINVVVSGLRASGQIVSTFDLDVTYDPVILDALGVRYGDGLGGGSANSVQFAPTVAGGNIDFREISLLSDFGLDALQGDSVILAALTFRTIGVGIGSLEFVQDALFMLTGRFGISGIPTDLVPDISGGRVRVDPRLLPGPGVIELFGIGFIAWSTSRFRRRSVL